MDIVDDTLVRSVEADGDRVPVESRTISTRVEVGRDMAEPKIELSSPNLEPTTDKKGTKSKAKKAKGTKKRKNSHKSGKLSSQYTRDKSEVLEGGYFAKVAGYMDEESSDSSNDDSSSSSSSSSPGDEGDDGSSGSSLSSSSSSSSSDSDSSSSDSEDDAGVNKKILRKALSSMKIDNPPVYKGNPNLDEFDHWIFAVHVWVKRMGLSNKWAVRLLVNFVKDQASVFYMKHVALKPKKWTLRKIFNALFDYCFPLDYKLQLR